MNDFDAAARALRDADAVVIGASNGLSIAEGYHIFADNQWLRENFGDFRSRYGLRSVLDGCFFDYPSEEEYWAFWSHLSTLVTYGKAPSATMEELARITDGKDRFALTTNGEGHFQQAGFNEDEVFEMEGGFTKNRCAHHCSGEVYPNRERMLAMAKAQRDGKVPRELVPRCPLCGGPMKVNVAESQTFFQTPAWQAQRGRFQEFAECNHGKNVVFLELGVGWRNQLVKEPMHALAAREPQGAYIVFNMGETVMPRGYQGARIALEGDIARTVAEVAARLKASA